MKTVISHDVYKDGEKISTHKETLEVLPDRYDTPLLDAVSVLVEFPGLFNNPDLDNRFSYDAKKNCIIISEVWVYAKHDERYEFRQQVTEINEPSFALDIAIQFLDDNGNSITKQIADTYIAETY